MKKIETIYHYLLWQALDQNQFRHTQQQLAADFNYSTGTIHYALERPTQIGAIRKAGKFFVLQDFNKLLYYWANLRNTTTDTLQRFQLNLSVTEIEASLPPQAILGGYSAATTYLKEPPADYDRVSIYIQPNLVSAITNRYPQANIITATKDYPQANLEVLRLPSQLPVLEITTTPILAFVDIWNKAEWYAHDFTKELQKEFDAILS